MITDQSYFVGELNIPNTDKTEVLENFQLYIDEYEPKYLTLLLGPSLYASFTAGLAADPLDPIWTKLKNQIFVISGTSKVSPVANFIYFYLVRRSTYDNSGIGLTQAKAENATIIDSRIETSRAWNKMNALSFSVYKFLKANAATYGPLPYDLRYCNDFNEYWFDWSYWWGWFPYVYRRLIPEIYRPINALGL